MYNFRHLYLARVHKGTETKTNREIKKQNGHCSSTNPCTGQCLALGWKSSVHPLPAQQNERDNKGMLRLEEQLEEEQQKVFIAFNTREEHKRKKKTKPKKEKQRKTSHTECPVAGRYTKSRTQNSGPFPGWRWLRQTKMYLPIELSKFLIAKRHTFSKIIETLWSECKKIETRRKLEKRGLVWNSLEIKWQPPAESYVEE